jgi:hypothetical protein
MWARSPRLRGMKTNHLFIGLASVVAMLLGGAGEARAFDTHVVPGFSIRNGDWIAIDALGVGLLGSTAPGCTFALVLRGELGLGGASAGFGLATNMFAEACSAPGGCDMSEFLGSGMMSLEARVARMYGPTSWRSTTYVGGQLSFALTPFIPPHWFDGPLNIGTFKPSIGVMVDPHDPRDKHTQIAVGGGW